MKKKTPQQGPAAEWVPIGELKMDPKNLKTGHDVDGIANSQAQFGWGEVIVARQQDGMIIDRARSLHGGDQERG